MIVQVRGGGGLHGVLAVGMLRMVDSVYEFYLLGCWILSSSFTCSRALFWETVIWKHFDPSFTSYLYVS